MNYTKDNIVGVKYRVPGSSYTYQILAVVPDEEYPDDDSYNQVLERITCDDVDDKYHNAEEYDDFEYVLGLLNNEEVVVIDSINKSYSLY